MSSVEDKNYIYLYGGLSHLLFLIVFSSFIQAKNTRRIILVLGHFFISLTFLLRFFTEYKNFIITGIIGHSIVTIFFILTTILDNMKYRITSDKHIFNFICILGQIGMILHYITIGVDRENENIFMIMNIITCILLITFYYNVAIKQTKKDRVLIYPLLLLCILYMLFTIETVMKFTGVDLTIIKDKYLN